jgi:membrane associated rhomboid family serine protease
MTEEQPGLPPPLAPQPQPVDFMTTLRQVTPHLRVVPGVIALNLVVFVVMVATGVGAFSPAVTDLLVWGANYGPKTLGGEPWRLLTSTFLHAGAVHLAMNMIVLADSGRIVERLFGPGRFAAIYFVAGVLGSVASMAIHPGLPSVGASGAVFGVYGALGGFLLRERGTIPPGLLKRLGRGAVGFVFLNLAIGLAKPGVDLAAHVGGLIAGVAAGAALSLPLAPGRRGKASHLVYVSAACVLAVSLALLLLPPLGSAGMTRRQLPGFSIELPAGQVREEILDYQGGRIVVMRETGQRTVIAVSWQGGNLSRSEFETIAGLLAPKMGLTSSGRGLSLPGPMKSVVQTMAFDGDLQQARMSALGCGVRTVMLMTLGPTGAEQWHRAILPTIVCSPDQAQEDATAKGTLPFAANLPGWYVQERSSGQLLLTDGSSTLLVRSGVVSTTGQFADVVEISLGATGGQFRLTSREKDSARFNGVLDTHLVEGWARAVSCRTGGLTLLLVAPDRRIADELWSLTASARCTNPGEVPTEWPDVPKGSER